MAELLQLLKDWARKETAYLRYEQVWRWLTRLDSGIDT